MCPISMDSDDSSNSDADSLVLMMRMKTIQRKHPFESVDTNDLAPLSEENDPKYPQEDAKYFRAKNYVRKTKCELSWLKIP